MPEVLPESLHDEPPADGWTNRISWGAMLALGWLIYEVTARPTFGIAVACGKFGWDDFLTAQWLWRTDPVPGRGRTCFWFFVANGVWKITIAAFLATGGLLILMVALNHNLPRELIGLGVTAAIGVSLLAVLPLIGVAHARSHGVRVWIDGAVHQSRKAGLWPPEATGFNCTMGLLFPALLAPIVLSAVMTFPFGIVAMLTTVFGEGLFIWSLFRGVCADSPEECWGEFDAMANEGAEGTSADDGEP